MYEVNWHSPHTRGLVGLWSPRVSEKSNELPNLTGQGGDGVLTNGVLRRYRSRAGPMLQFDGTDDIVDCGTIPLGHRLQMLGQKISIALWFVLDSTSDDWARIVDKASGGDGADGWSLFLGHVTDSMRVIFKMDVASTYTATGAYSYNTLHHLVVAHDGTAGGGECFIDGLDEGMSVNNAYTIPDVSTDLIIGGALWTTGRDFKGLLSDVRVYNRKLTLQEARDQFLHPLALYQPRRMPWRAAAAGPTWVSPANYSDISSTPVLVFETPIFTGNVHFHIELDKVNTFDGVNLRTLKTNHSQTNWEYWDGDSWEPFPATGLPDTYAGNNCRYTVTSELSEGTWYRRVRYGAT